MKIGLSVDQFTDLVALTGAVTKAESRTHPILGFVVFDLRRRQAPPLALAASHLAEGRLAPSDPHHLIFSIWALTQHYADFAPQVQAVLGEGRDPIEEGQRFAETLYRRMLTP